MFLPKGAVARLTEEDMVGLGVCFAADGLWTPIGLEAREAEAMVMSFFNHLTVPRRDRLKSVVQRTMNSLMATRRSGFDKIQEEPPFSLFAAETLREMEKRYTDDGPEEARSYWRERFSPDVPVQRVPAPIVQVEDRGGDSAENAIEIAAPDQESWIYAQYWYLSYWLGRDWKSSGHMTPRSTGDGYHYSELWLEMPDETPYRVWFRIKGMPQKSRRR